jgi:hypothetical protein
MGRGEVPKKCRDIRTQENQDPVILEIPRRDPSCRTPRRTCVRILERVSKTRGIGVLEHLENIVARNRDSQISDKIQTVYISGNVEEICTIGESPDKE